MTGAASEHAIRTVTGATFEAQILGGRGPIVVEFMSYGCVHCRQIEPVVEQVARMVKSTESIFRLNIAADEDVADRYQVESTPTFVMFRDGTEVGRVVGPSPNVPDVLAALTEPFEP